MGDARWSATDWDRISTATVGKATHEIFAEHLHPDLNPMGVVMRESRDSASNPNSNAIIVALDVTGSMGMIADNLAREGLGTLVEEILERKPVSDPHIMMMGVGDAYCDRAPLQVTQFEADKRIAEQLQKLYLEHGGGANDHESYHLPLYFAAMHTSIDCFEKRGRKGYLFTIGDELPPKELLASQIMKICGGEVARDFTTRELLTMAERMYHVFHIVIEKGSFASRNLPAVMREWGDLIGAQRVIPLADHRKLAEVVVSTIQVVEGSNPADVSKSWSGDTSLVVARAINGIVPAGAAGTSVVRF